MPRVRDSLFTVDVCSVCMLTLFFSCSHTQYHNQITYIVLSTCIGPNAQQPIGPILIINNPLWTLIWWFHGSSKYTQKIISDIFYVNYIHAFISSPTFVLHSNWFIIIHIIQYLFITMYYLDQCDCLFVHIESNECRYCSVYCSIGPIGCLYMFAPMYVDNEMYVIWLWHCVWLHAKRVNTHQR